jgi:hypothetical protein
MAEEVGSEIIVLVKKHLSKVKQALTSRSNMDKTLKEEATNAVSEMECLLNQVGGMFLGLESSLGKALSAAEEKASLYSEQLATSMGPKSHSLRISNPRAQSGGGPPQTAGIIVRAADPTTAPHEAKRIIKEAVDPKSLKLGINKVKYLANNAVLVECESKADSDILEKELSKLSSVTVERPKRKLPTILLKYVPNEVDDEEIKDTIIHQNNLSHLVDPTLNVKFTKRSFNEARHVVIEVSPKLRRELISLEKIKIRWSMCRAEDFVAVTRCFRCLGFGHTSKFCQSQQKCSYCAEDHHWKECGQQHQTQCSNCLKANSYIQEEGKKYNTNHSVFSKDCPKLKRIEALVISKTEY